VAGLAGAIFAVPLVAVANTVVQYLFGVDKFPELGTNDHVPLLRRPSFEQTFAVLRRGNRNKAEEVAASHNYPDSLGLDDDDDDVVAAAAVVPEGEL